MTPKNGIVEELNDLYKVSTNRSTRYSRENYGRIYRLEDAWDSWFTDSETAEYYGINELDAHECSN